MTNTSHHTLGPVILDAIQKWPRGLDAVCLVSPERLFSASEVLQTVRRGSQYLIGQGIHPGDVVLLATGRGHRFWIDLLSLWLIGAVAVPIDASPARSRLAVVSKISAARFLLGSNDLSPESQISVIRSDYDQPAKLCPCESLEELHPRDPAATAIILFTSGTTGEPKGVALSHNAVLGNALATKDRVKLWPTDTLGSAIPFRFVSALSHFLVAILSGSTYAGTEQSFRQTGFIEYLTSVRCTAYGGSPLQARWIAEWLETLSDGERRERVILRWIMSSGDYFPEEVGRRLMTHIHGCRLVIAYGLTESGGRMCCRVVDCLDMMGESGAVGSPINGLELEAFDEEMGRCRPNEIGRLFVRGGYLFSGYVSDAKATVNALNGEWLNTGDFGFKNGSGSLIIRGRSDEVFKVAGVKVSTLVIAEALSSFGVFADLAVVQHAHNALGSVPYVYYTLVAERVFDRGSIMRNLRGQLPGSHLPWKFIRVERIPRTGSGKIDRREMQGLMGY